MAEEITVQGRLSKVKDAKTKKDKDYIQVTIAGWTYSIFKAGEFAQFYDNEGKTVEIQYTMSDDEEYRNYVPGSFKVLSDTAEASHNGMTKEEWAEKGRFITRTAIAKSCIEGAMPADKETFAYAEKWFDWIYQIKTPVSPPAESKNETPEVKPEVPEGIDTSPIENLPDLTARFKKYFGEGRTNKEMSAEIMEFAKVKTPTELGKRSVDDLNLLWLGICVAKKQTE